jgi:hypothetical protein
MASQIEDQFMTAEYNGRVIATAQYSLHASDGQGAWVVSGLPHRLFSRNEAITALAVGAVQARALTSGGGVNRM